MDKLKSKCMQCGMRAIAGDMLRCQQCRRYIGPCCYTPCWVCCRNHVCRCCTVCGPCLAVNYKEGKRPMPHLEHTVSVG